MLILHLRINAVYILSTGTLQLWLLSGRTGIFPFRGGVTGIINIFWSVCLNVWHGLFFFCLHVFLFMHKKTHLHSSGGEECFPITCRVAGFPDVCCALWGTVHSSGIFGKELSMLPYLLWHRIHCTLAYGSIWFLPYWSTVSYLRC